MVRVQLIIFGFNLFVINDNADDNASELHVLLLVDPIVQEDLKDIDDHMVRDCFFNVTTYRPRPILLYPHSYHLLAITRMQLDN